MRVALVVLGAQADLLHHRLHFGPAFGPGQVGVDQQRFGQLVADFLPGVERGERALENHLHVAAHLLALAFAGAGDFMPSDFQRAGRGLLDQGQGAGQGGLAATRFTDHGQRLAGFEFERHAIEGAHQRVALEQATGHFVVTGKVAGGKYDGHHATSWFSG
ncbi:hypothetical protein D9M71_685820 [compost metagenome]